MTTFYGALPYRRSDHTTNDVERCFRTHGFYLVCLFTFGRGRTYRWRAVHRGCSIPSSPRAAGWVEFLANDRPADKLGGPSRILRESATRVRTGIHRCCGSWKTRAGHPPFEVGSLRVPARATFTRIRGTLAGPPLHGENRRMRPRGACGGFKACVEVVRVPSCR